jgi:hypothetical protein
MTTFTPALFDEINRLVKLELTHAQKQFAKNPTATHWLVTLRAMFVWQQLNQMGSPSRRAMRDDLYVALGSTPRGEWGNLISRQLTGLPIDEAVKA